MGSCTKAHKMGPECPYCERDGLREEVARLRQEYEDGGPGFARRDVLALIDARSRNQLRVKKLENLLQEILVDYQDDHVHGKIRKALE